MKKRICILYTGGTIGMVPSEKGYVPSSGAFLDLLRAIPDLYWADMPAWDVVEFDPLLDSSAITVPAINIYKCPSFILATLTRQHSASSV